MGLKIKKSSISGKGVFTDKEIKKGDLVYTLSGKECTLDEIIKLCNEKMEEPSDSLGIGEELYLDLDEFSRTFNHSCNPNCFIQKKSNLVAIRDIKIGEEVTYDYSTTMSDNTQKIISAGREIWSCKCNCKDKKCRGRIDQFVTLPKSLQTYYIKNKFMPNFMLKKFGRNL